MSESEHYSRLRDDADHAARGMRNALFHFRSLRQDADDYDLGALIDIGLDRAEETMERYVRKLQELAGRFESQRLSVERQEADDEAADALPQPQRCPHVLPDRDPETDATPEEREAWRKIVRAATERRAAELREP